MEQKEEEILKKIVKLSEDIQKNPNNDSNFNQRGNYYYELKKYDEAITDYSEAIKINPKNATYYNYRGNAYYSLKKYNEAIADYSEAIKINPKNTAYYNNRGNVYYYNLKKYDEAIADYSEAIKINPKNAIYYNNRGNVYYNLKKYDEAIADYSEAIRIDSKNAIYYNNRGNVYYNLEKYDEAIINYDEAIRINPKYEISITSREKAMKKNKSYASSLKEKSIQEDIKFEFETLYLDYLSTSFSNNEEMKRIKNAFDSRIKELEEKKNLTQQEEEEKSKCKKYSKLIKLEIKEIKGLLTFADILGWKRIWQKDDIENSIENLINIKKDLENEVKNKCVHINLISDTFVISVNEDVFYREQANNLKNWESVFMLSNYLCKKLIEFCLSRGLLIRGATAYGECYTKEMVYIGKSVDEAASWHEKSEEVGIFYTPSARLKLIKEYFDLRKEDIKEEEIKKLNLEKGEISGKASEKIKTIDTFFINWYKNNEDYFYEIMESEIVHPEISSKYFNTEKQFKKLNEKDKKKIRL